MIKLIFNKTNVQSNSGRTSYSTNHPYRISADVLSEQSHIYILTHTSDILYPLYNVNNTSVKSARE